MSSRSKPSQKNSSHNVYLYLIFSLPVTILIFLIWALFSPGIGANIGAGILVFIGLILTIAGLFGFIATGSPKGTKKAAISLIVLVVLLPALWLLLENESNKQFCREKRDGNEAIFQESVSLCKKYFPEVNYKVIE